MENTEVRKGYELRLWRLLIYIDHLSLSYPVYFRGFTHKAF